MIYRLPLRFTASAFTAFSARAKASFYRRNTESPRGSHLRCAQQRARGLSQRYQKLQEGRKRQGRESARLCQEAGAAHTSLTHRQPGWAGCRSMATVASMHKLHVKGQHEREQSTETLQTTAASRGSSRTACPAAGYNGTTKGKKKKEIFAHSSVSGV